jgi:hypothetical protein
MSEHLAEIVELQGWATLEIDDEGIRQTQEEQAEKAREIASLFHRVFKQNADGKRLLNLMMEATLLRPTVLPDSTEFDAGIREGRCDMVRQILQNIELAERE